MIKKIMMYLFVVLLHVCGLHGAGTPSDQHFITLYKNIVDEYKLTIDPTHKLYRSIQSLSHCLHPEINDSLLSAYSIQQKISSIGKHTLESMINKALTREQELVDTHYVFYHGCKIEFLLFQDLLKFIAETLSDYTLDDFFLLRTPEADYATFHTIRDFLLNHDYDINDSIDPARKLLLSVNPSLFGNSIYRETSSAFCYFLNSKTAFTIKILPILSAMFEHYGHTRLYTRHLSSIQQLNTYLTSYEDNKTGILLQIFIPKKDVDTIVYRSLPRGIPYHGRSRAHPLSSELQKYQLNDVSIKRCSGSELDEMQFRILLDTNHMLNLQNETRKNPIKIFRYYNQTPQIKAYRKEIGKLKDTMRMELL